MYRVQNTCHIFSKLLDVLGELTALEIFPERCDVTFLRKLFLLLGGENCDSSSLLTAIRYDSARTLPPAAPERSAPPSINTSSLLRPLRLRRPTAAGAG